MKVGAFILLCLSVLTFQCSDGQDTNKTAEVLGKAQDSTVSHNAMGCANVK